jgi:hypothetical protein
MVGQVSNLPHTACWGRLETCPTTHAIENRCKQSSMHYEAFPFSIFHLSFVIETQRNSSNGK